MFMYEPLVSSAHTDIHQQVLLAVEKWEGWGIFSANFEWSTWSPKPLPTTWTIGPIQDLHPKIYLEMKMVLICPHGVHIQHPTMMLQEGERVVLNNGLRVNCEMQHNLTSSGSVPMPSWNPLSPLVMDVWPGGGAYGSISSISSLVPTTSSYTSSVDWLEPANAIREENGLAPLDSPPSMTADSVKGTIIERCPGIADYRTGCPVDGCDDAHSMTYVIVSLVPHLNDNHKWTREEIADWIDSLPIDTTIISKEEVESRRMEKSRQAFRSDLQRALDKSVASEYACWKELLAGPGENKEDVAQAILEEVLANITIQLEEE